MQNPESFEEFESPVEREQLVLAFMNDPDGPETRELLRRWKEQAEAEADKEGSGGRIAPIVAIAEIYRDAGMVDAAKSSYEDAAMCAYMEGDHELYETLTAEAERLG